MGQNKTKVISARVNDLERSIVQSAADKAGVSLAKYVVQIVVPVALKNLTEKQAA